MSELTDYTENKLADHMFRTASYTKPTQLNFELYTLAPGEAGGGTKVTGGSYAPVNLPPLDSNYNGTHGNTTGASSGTGGQIDNAVVITYPTPTASWGTVVAMGVEDQLSNLLMYTPLAANKTINNGDPAPTFPVGNFTATFD